MIPQPVRDPEDAHDAWALTSSGYDIEKFYLRASDSRGHNEVVHVKVSPNLKAMLGRVISQEGLPYTSQADVVRDALIHRFRWLEQARANGVDLQGLTDEEMFLADVELARRTRELRAEAARSAFDWVQQLMADGRRHEAIEWVDRYEAMVSEYDEPRARATGYQNAEQMREFIENPIRALGPQRSVG